MTDSIKADAFDEVVDTKKTACCVVGGGPGGVFLALLLARTGVDVTLLEAHKDFDRDFRGDTIHPSTLEILDQIGLADKLLEIPHGKIQTLTMVTPTGNVTIADMTHLKTRFPYIAMLPQVRLLDFLVAEARRFPSFTLITGATVQRLVEVNGTVTGVRYRDTHGGWHEVLAPLTVAADGRFSKIRSLAGLTPIKNAPPMDVVWFRLPRHEQDRRDTGAFYIQGGHFAVVLDRGDEWQIGYVILKGTYAELRDSGIAGLRESLAQLVPWLADRVDALEDWKQVSVLSVESSRLPQWHKPGLLLIGDAAHVMSPVGGVGINYAVQDAVEAANILTEPLRQGIVPDSVLAAIQKRRELPTKAIQAFQGFLQNQIASPALDSGQSFQPPLVFRLMRYLPFVRDIPARMIAFGIRHVRVADAIINASKAS